MTRIAVALVALTFVACAGSRAERAQPEAVRPAPAPTGDSPGALTGPTGSTRPSSPMSAVCPMDVPGTTVAAADTPEGESITFTTSSGQVDELRRRVHALADMHNQHMSAHAGAHPPGAPGTGSGEGDPHGAGHMMPPTSRATVDDVDNGARVSIAALDPAQAPQLRTMVRTHAEHMQQSGCGMMHGGPSQR